MENEFFIRVNEFYTYLRYWSERASLPEEKFILLGHYRSGTTLLTDLLNSHPHIHCDGEIFLPFVKLKFKKVLSPYAYIHYHASQHKQSIYGFDLKEIQLLEILTRFHMKPEEFLLNLHQKGWKILYLKRLNLFRQAVSNLIAKTRNKWHEKQNELLQHQSMFIETKQILREIKSQEKSQTRSLFLLKNVPYLEINHEIDLLNSDRHQTTLERVFDYLEVEAVPVKTQHKKVSQKDLSQDIENYQEVVNFISQTNYAEFLDAD